MKKWTKIVLFVGLIVIVGGGLLFANSIFGNPLSKVFAKSKVKTYIANTYSEENLEIDDLFYNFKDGYYHVKVQSPSSIDTHFTVYVSRNKVVSDSYEHEVANGWNTYERINDVYRQMVDQLFSSPSFPLASHIAYGEIALTNEEAMDIYIEPDYGVQLQELALDKKYDVKKLAKTTGHIVFYAEDEEISFEKASAQLLLVKNALDEASIPFYAIDFVLEKPRTSDGVANEDDAIHTAHFLYDDIYENGLTERIEKAHDELMDYYAEQDAKWKEMK